MKAVVLVGCSFCENVKYIWTDHIFCIILVHYDVFQDKRFNGMNLGVH